MLLLFPPVPSSRCFLPVRHGSTVAVFRSVYSPVSEGPGDGGFGSASAVVDCFRGNTTRVFGGTQRPLKDSKASRHW